MFAFYQFYPCFILMRCTLFRSIPTNATAKLDLLDLVVKMRLMNAYPIHVFTGTALIYGLHIGLLHQ